MVFSIFSATWIENKMHILVAQWHGILKNEIVKLFLYGARKIGSISPTFTDTVQTARTFVTYA